MGAPFSTLPPRLPARRGFALLITITLLAFIVVLLVGLAAYTRVETAVAGNTQRQAQARENALLGLQVALGQLQRYAGPDTRVTATAQNFGGIDGTRAYTGVWSSDPAATEAATMPLTWLVSGNELTAPDTTQGAAAGSTVPAPRAILPSAPGSNTVDLVGRNSVGTTARTNFVAAPLQDIRATGVPGFAAATTPPVIGRYAWWVGDQGVKAPVAVADTTSTITFAPYDSDELRARLRQQMPLGAGAANATDGTTLFEPRDSNNSALVANGKVSLSSQIAFLRNSSNGQLGLTRLQQNFHAWSPNNFAVLANTKDGGLRQDLSLKPDLLGAPFAAWVNYPAYMEKFRPDPVVDTSGTGTGATEGATPVASTTPTILPAYDADPLRRRYVMTPHLRTGNTGGSHQVTPVLTYFLLSFNVRTAQTAGGNASSAPGPLEVRARWMISLWNPYTSALVPENLQADVTGLPTLDVVDEEPTRSGVVARVPLTSSYGNPLRINLPWNSEAPEGGSAEDRQSWLPGRVYTWRSAEDLTKATSVTDGFGSAFYSQTLDEGGAGVIRSINAPAVDGNDPCHLVGNGTGQIRVRLYVLRADGSRLQVGDFRSPQFVASFTTATQAINLSGYQFSYLFRLAESVDTPSAPGTWLTAPSRDPRLSRLTGEFFVVGENGDDPAQYGDSYRKIRSPGRLLDRAADSVTYNEDVPVFELPRAPIVSLGALQHFRIVGSRPFMIGNSWGTAATLNGHRLGALFDRFYFSGVVDGMDPAKTSTGDLIMPNALLKPLRKADGERVTVDDIRATATVAPPADGTTTDDTTAPETPDETPPDATTTVPDQTDARSSKFFLQAGAFNLNSTERAAWAAVLRSVRFPTSGSAFSYLNASATTGTAADADRATVDPSSDAQFFRFPQSAQETYKAEPGFSATGDEAATPPNTHLFRKGMRTLSGAQVAALAGRIVELMATKHADSGPFRSLEEFLSPSTLFAGVDADGNPGASRSLLEAAIADAGINADIAEFSSQWLTQGDVMTSLAPILFPRSDTFVIRTYGEAVNPATNSIEGRAWGEAIVQRMPEYFDRSMPAESLPAAFEPTANPDAPDTTPTATPAQTLNKLYGRRFKIVSFRWLTRSDI